MFSRPPPSTTRPSLRVETLVKIRATRFQLPLDVAGVTRSDPSRRRAARVDPIRGATRRVADCSPSNAGVPRVAAISIGRAGSVERFQAVCEGHSRDVLDALVPELSR